LLFFKSNTKIHKSKNEIKEFKENTIYTIIDGIIKFNSKIKQDEYKPVYNTNKYNIVNKDLVGHWLKFDSTGNFHTSKYTYGDYYYCFDYARSNNHIIMVYDDFGYVHEEGKGIFKTYDFKLKFNTPLICCKDIRRKVDNSIIFKENDVVIFIRYSVNKDNVNDDTVYYSVGKGALDEHLYRVPSILLKPLNDIETKEYLALNEISPANQAIIPFIDNTPNVTTNNIEEEEKEQEEEDNIEKEAVVSIPQVQLDSLIGDINNSLNKLKEQTFEVEDIKLQTKLIGAIAEIEDSITNKVKEITYY